MVHQKMKMYSLSTHHYADEGLGEVFESSKHSVAAKSNTIEVNGDLFFKGIKTTDKNIKCLHTAPVVASKCLLAPTFKFVLEWLHIHHVLSLEEFESRGLQTLVWHHKILCIIILIFFTFEELFTIYFNCIWFGSNTF